MGKFYQVVADDLSLYARQLGWFHSSPKSTNVKDKEQSKTRLQKITDTGRDPLFPDVGDAEYMVAYWQLCGMVLPGFYGPSPLTASEVTFWAEAVGVHLSPWEHRTLRDMSRAYISGLNDGAERDSVPPYGSAVVEHNRDEVSRKVSTMFKAFTRKT